MSTPYESWDAESRKLFTGTEWQQGSAATLRDVEAFLQNVEAGVTDIKQLRDWLGRCLYACNMENFR